MKSKECSYEGCNKPRFSNKLCTYHHKLEFPSKYQIKKSSSFGKKVGTIKPISDKRKERLEKYYGMRDEYFREHPICEFPGCSSKDITLHHKSGRIGDNLFKDFCSLCVEHHSWAEAHPKEAKEMGLSKNRL